MKLLFYPTIFSLCIALNACNALQQLNIRPASEINPSDISGANEKEQALTTAAKNNKPANENATPTTPPPAIKPHTNDEAHTSVTTNVSIASGASATVTLTAPKAKTEQKYPPFPIDIWERLRQGYQLRDYQHKRVRAELSWYARHDEYIERVTERAEPFLHWILAEVEKRKLPSEIALLPIVESAFQPFAYSHGRASGIWQFIPGTGRRFGLKQNWWYDGRRDVIASTQAAIAYLDYLQKQFDGDWLLALAAYNSGEGTVYRAIRKNKRKGKPTDFWHLDLPPETRSYVPKLLAVSALFENPGKYNITLKSIPNEPRITTVNIGSQIDLALAADLAALSLEDIYKLNPGYNRWATDPNGPHRLVIPIKQESIFRKNLAKLPKAKRIKWKRHKIRNGEAISVIARHYHTSVGLLRKINGLRSNRIRAGKYLIIPVATRSLQQYSLSLQQRKKSLLAKSRVGKKIIHQVVPGDTFWDLSLKYHVNVNQLALWNGMAPADTLKTGQKLVIWVKHNIKSNKVVSRVSFTLPAATVRPIRYVVRSGDSLARIASRFNVSVKQLRKWNHLQGKKYLHPGQTLKLYVDVTQQT